VADHGPDPHLEVRRLTPLELLVVFTGIGLHGVLGVLVVVTGLVAPVGAVGFLAAVWLALTVVGIRSWRRRPWSVVVLPIVGYAVWLGTLFVGAQYLGWSP
jgi:hypothetical protein